MIPRKFDKNLAHICSNFQEPSINKKLLFTLTILSEVQILSFILHFQFFAVNPILIQSSHFLDFLQRACGIFTGHMFKEHLGLSKTISVVWLLILMSFNFFIIFKRQAKRLDHIQIAAFMFIELNESIVLTVLGTNLLWKGSKQNDVSCIIIFVLLYTITLCNTMAIQDSFESSNLFRQRNRKLKVCVLLTKLFFNIMSIVADSSSVYWLIGLFCLVANSKRFEVFFTANVFWDYDAEIIYKKFTSASSLLALFTIIIGYSNLKENLSLFLVEFILTIFIIKCSEIKSRHKMIQNINKLTTGFKSPEDILSTIISINSLRKNISYVVIDDSDLLRSDYLLSLIGQMKYSMTSELPLKALISRLYAEKIDQILEYGLKKFPHSYDLIMHSCYHLSGNNETILKAFKLMSSIQSKNLSWKEFSNYLDFKRLLEDRAIENRELLEKSDYLNVKEIIEENSFIEEFINLVTETTRLYIGFWDEFFKLDNYIVKQKEKNLIIQKNFTRLETLWAKITEKSGHWMKNIWIIYHQFLYFVMNSPSKASKIKETADFFSKIRKEDRFIPDLNLKTIRDSKNIILIVSISGGRAGKIISVTKSVFDQLQFPRAEIVGRNAGIIMPKIIGNSHRNFWKNYTKLDMDINKETESYCISRRGILKKYTILVRLNPCIEENLTAFCALRPKREDLPTAIVFQGGKIDSFNYLFKSLFILKNSQELTFDDLVKMKNLKLHLSAILLRQSSLELKRVKSANHNLYFNALRSHKKINFSFEMNDEIINFYFEIEEKKIFNEEYFLIYVKEEEPYSKDLSISELSSESIPNEEVHQVELRISTYNINSLETARDPGLNYESPREGETLRSLLDTKREIKRSLLIKKWSDSLVKAKNLRPYRPQNDSDMMIDDHNTLTTKKGQSSVSSSNSSKSHQKLIEKLINSSQNTRSSKFLFYYGAILVLLACASLIYYQTNISKTLSIAQGEIDVILACTITQRELTRLSRLVLSYYLIGKGIWRDDRYTKGNVDNLRALRHRQLPVRAAVLNQNKNLIRNSLFQLNEEFQNKILNQRMKVFDRDDLITQRAIHPFDFITEIYDASVRIVEVDPLKVTHTNKDVMYFVNNAFDEVLINFEETLNILQADTYKQLESNIILSEILVGVVVCFGFTLLICFTINSKIFIEDRNTLINIIQSLEEERLKYHLNLVSKFYDNLIEAPGAHPLKWIEWIEAAKDYKKVDRIERQMHHRKYNPEGINNPLYKLFAFSLIWCMMFLIPFLIVLSISRTFQAEIMNHINNENRVNQALYNMDLMVSGFYFNVTDGPTKTEKLTSVVEIIDQYYPLYFKNIEFFKFLEKEYNDEILTTYLLGDLCALGSLVQTQFNSTVCYRLSNEAMKRGMVGIIEAIASAHKTAFLDYSSSDYSLNEKINSFADPLLIDSEIIIVYMMYQPFLMVQNRIHEIMINNLDGLDSLMIKITIPFTVCLFFIGLWIWIKISSELVDETKAWIKMIRLIPVNIVTSNKILLAFMKKGTSNLE